MSAAFNAYGETQVNIDLCDTKQEILTIENLDNIEQQILISTEGPEIARFSEIDFFLQPAETKKVIAEYVIPCDMEQGTYDLNIYFTSYDTELYIPQKITINQKDTINLTTKTAERIIPTCGTAKYNLTLTNSENKEEQYTLEVEGYKEAYLSETFFILSPGEKKQLQLIAEPQDCTNTGEYEININTETQTSEKNLKLTLNIINTGIPEIQTKTTQIRADYEKSSVSIPIKNTGSKESSYKFTTEGLEWVEIAPTELNLRPGETKEIKLLLNPTKDTAEGNHVFTLNMILEETGITYDTRFTIKLGPPTILEKNPAIGIAAIILLVTIIGGFLALIIYLNLPKIKRRRKKKKEAKRERKIKKIEDKKKAKLAKKRAKQARILARKRAKQNKIKKRKELKEKKKQERENAKRKKQEAKQKKIEKKKQAREKQKEEKTRVVRTKQETLKKLKLKKEEEQKIKNELKNELEEKYHIIPRKEPKKQNKKGLLLILAGVILLLLAFSIDIIIINWQVSTIAFIILLLIILVHKAIKGTKAEHKIKFLKEGRKKTFKIWKKGLVEIVAKAKKDIAETKVVAIKTKNILEKGKHYQSFEIHGDDIEYTLRIKVEKNWLKKHNILSSNLMISKLNTNWRKTDFKKTAEDDKYEYYTAEVGTGTYTIHGQQEQKDTKKPKRAVIISAIVILTLVALAFWPGNSIYTKGIPPQTWGENTQKVIQLTDYFKDPDGDQLYFGVTETQYITIDLKGNIAILTPPPNWRGTERVRFLADDGKGGTAQSNIVLLSVKRTLATEETKNYFIMGVGIIALLTLMMGMITLNKRKKRVSQSNDEQSNDE